MRRWALGLLLSTAFFFTSLVAPATAAHADATILSSTNDNGYPKQLTFNVTAQAAVDITDVTLNYAITGTGTGALGKPSDPIAAGKTVSASVVVQVNSGSSYIPVGSNFTYHWQITTSDGNVTNGPDSQFLFLPPNQDWKSVSGDFMTVYYHSNNQSLANAYLQAGVETYAKIGKLLNTTLKLTPVKVILFDTEQEMSAGLPGNGATFDGAVTTCGTKVTQDIVLVIPLSCGSTDPTDTLRHEFGHILNQTAGGGAFGKLPSWIDEGTAVYAQTTPGDNYISAFQAAVRANRLIRVSTMGTAPSDPNLVNLFYGQSYSMVKYLIDTGGPAKYAQFFATIQQGNRFDQAMSMVYGFDLPTFEKQFDASVGSQAPSAPTAAPTARPRAQSTAAPAPTRATSLTSSSSGGSDRTSIVIVGGAALLFLIGAFALLAATMIANNRRRSSRAAALPPVEPPDLPPPAPGA